MKGIKKRFKKDSGFTLVEIIVVLVILAILAAFAIPTMLGFVQDAKGKAYIAEAREVYVAAQSVATEYIATTNITDGNNTSLGTGNEHGSGLGASLGSFEVQYRHNRWTSDPIRAQQNAQWNASEQMYKYVAGDLKPIYDQNTFRYSDVALPNNGNNAVVWYVTVGDSDDTVKGDGLSGSSRTGKVTKVVYIRNGYKVTIAGNNATVEKLQN